MNDKLPPAAKQIENLLRDTAKVVTDKLKGHSIFVPKEIHDERWKICQSCDQLTAENRCMQCGCFMKVKSQLASMECPIGKWNRLSDDALPPCDECDA